MRVEVWKISCKRCWDMSYDPTADVYERIFKERKRSKTIIYVPEKGCEPGTFLKRSRSGDD